MTTVRIAIRRLAVIHQLLGQSQCRLHFEVREEEFHTCVLRNDFWLFSELFPSQTVCNMPCGSLSYVLTYFARTQPLAEFFNSW